VKLNVVDADLVFEGVFTRPEFALFRDASGLVGVYFDALQKNGLRVQDIKIDLASGTLADSNISFQLFNSQLGVYIRQDRVAVVCTHVRDDQISVIGSVGTDVMSLIQSYRPGITFGSYSLNISLNGTLEGSALSDYLSRFVVGELSELGPRSGSGAAFYFGSREDRISSSLVMDLSGALAGGLFVRVNVVFDGRKLDSLAVAGRAVSFLRQALASVGLEVAALGV